MFLILCKQLEEYFTNFSYYAGDHEFSGWLQHAEKRNLGQFYATHTFICLSVGLSASPSIMFMSCRRQRCSTPV